MSAVFTVAVEDGGNPDPLVSVVGSIDTGGQDFAAINPAGPELKLMAKLSWVNNWDAYPTSDLELFIVGFSAAFEAVVIDFSGAGLNSPEGSDFGFNIPSAIRAENTLPESTVAARNCKAVSG